MAAISVISPTEYERITGDSLSDLGKEDDDPQSCGDLRCPQDSCKRLSGHAMYIYREENMFIKWLMNACYMSAKMSHIRLHRDTHLAHLLNISTRKYTVLRESDFTWREFDPRASWEVPRNGVVVLKAKEIDVFFCDDIDKVERVLVQSSAK